MSARAGTWLAAVASAAAFGVAFFARMNAAYGPFNLSADPADWRIVWELLRHGQIAGRVVAEGCALGLAAAAVTWLVAARARRRRG